MIKKQEQPIELTYTGGSSFAVSKSLRFGTYVHQDRQTYDWWDGTLDELFRDAEKAVRARNWKDR